jgi:hypothetical protein
MTQIGIHLMGHTVVTVYSMMNGLRSIHRQMKLMAHTAHTLDVVGMVVSNEQKVNPTHRQTIVLSMLLQRAYTDTGVYHQGIVNSV